MKPLEGIRVLDLTRVLAGPYSTMMMADYGAEVIKIEPPKVGDDSRAFGPYQGGESAYFMSLNRNKKSIELNFKNPEHVEIFKQLIPQFDVVVENYRPGTMEKFGLGYDVLREIKPDLIYAACSGFGDSGPYRLKPAYDVVIQAMGGVVSITGPEGSSGYRIGASLGDIIAGMFTGYGIMMALFHKQNTGEGQKIDVSMLDCQVAVLENAIARYATSGEIPRPLGNRHPSITPFSAFASADGSVIIGAGNDRLWNKLCEVLGRTDLLTDPRFLTNPDRTAHASELGQIMDEICKTKTTQEWVDLLEEAGVPVAPINTIDKVVNDPQITSREMIVEVEHPTAGKLRMAGVPVKMSLTPGSVDAPAPTLGQHTADILQEYLGWDADAAAAFCQE